MSPHEDRFRHTRRRLLAGAAAVVSGAATGGELFDAVRLRQRWLQGASWLPWAAILVSEPTRPFYAWRGLAERWLPRVLGAFCRACEDHLPVAVLNDRMDSGVEPGWGSRGKRGKAGQP